MPVEIKELIVKATVQNKQIEKDLIQVFEKKKDKKMTSFELSYHEKKEIIEECVKEVMELLEMKKNF
ncbi:MAG: hypothetical protein RJA52_597 [Bacteroidota bacterium]|jgi:hypothetical protein